MWQKKWFQFLSPICPVLLGCEKPDQKIAGEWVSYYILVFRVPYNMMIEIIRVKTRGILIPDAGNIILK
jgi:hypothetical protein